MLQYMRDKAASWIVLIFLGLIIFVFIFMGFGGGFDKDQSSVAEVNGAKIYRTEVQQQYKSTVNQIRRFNRGFVETEAIQKRLMVQARDQLIQEKLILQEAAKLGINADAEIVNYNYTNKAFMKDGKFDLAEYEKVLERQGMTASGYETRLGRFLLSEKMRAFIVNGVKISDEEIKNRFIFNETTVNADYVLFKPSEYPDAKYTDKDLSEYLMKNSVKYKTEPMVKVQYTVVNPVDYIKDIKFSDKEIENYYKTNSEEFETPLTVVARHILIRTKKDSTAKEIEAAKKKALDVYSKAKKGEDFAKLAKKYSEGPTAKSGGYLGAFKKGTMVKEFDEKAFSMKAGEISEPVKTEFGWHVIKVDKINPKKVKALKVAGKEIRAKLLKSKIENKAYEICDSIYDAVDKGDSFKEFAKTMKVKFYETDFFSKESLKIDPRVKKDFVEQSFKLFEGEISEPKVINGLFYLIKKVGKKGSEIAKMSKIKKRLIKDYLASKREESALKDAEKFAKGLKDEKSFAAQSKAMNKVSLSVSDVKRDQIIPNIGQNALISKALFRLSKDRVFTGVLKDVNGYYVFKLDKRNAPDMKKLDSSKAKIIQTLSFEKKNAVFTEWVAELKNKSEIKISR